ncbi:MAG: OmpA family protein [Pirellulaceae bacterium]|nr:OmpA family protein [Pirellulaceae bacterium]
MQHPLINRYCKPALVVAVCLISWGCQSGPIGPDGKFAWNQSQRQATDSANESDQKQQVNQLNNDNESLHAQLAQARQQYRVTAQELELIKSELKQATDKLANQPNPDQPANLAPPAVEDAIPVPSATNTQSLPLVDIQGTTTGRDGNTVRIEVATTTIFSPDEIALSSAGQTLLDQIASAVTTNYSKQIITIEAHAYQGDTPTEHHDLAARQAIAIYQYMQTQRLLPENQFIVMSRGSSAPRYSTATEQGRRGNSRIEFIVSPKAF